MAVKEIHHSSALLEPAPLDRKQPGETDWLEGDISKDVDPDGAGVTIASIQAAIRTEDDDGLLMLGTGTGVGTLLYRVGYTVDPTATQRMYGITVTITTSDSRVLEYDHSLPIVPTGWLHA